MKRDWQSFWLYAFHSIKWTAFAILLVPIYFVLMNPNFSQENYWGNLWFSTRIGIQIAIFYWLCSTVIYVFVYRYNPNLVLVIKKSLKIQILKGLGIMIVGLALTSITEPYLSGRQFGLQSITIGALVGGITFLVTVLYVAYRETKEHNLKLRAESAEGSLNVLKNQMQPHFLFNSLNSLSELIDSNNEHASMMAQKLSDLYREILTNSKTQFSSLASELSIIDKYLALEKIRCGERLKYKISSPKSTDHIYIPSLVLQTLVENSIKHRISKAIDGGVVEIDISPKADGYNISIIDTGENVAAKPSKNSGTGIENTKSRLSLIYGDKHKFKMNVTDDRTEVEFWITGKDEAEANQ